MPYAAIAVRLRAVFSLTGKARPAATCAPDAAASTASHPNVRDVANAPLVDGMAINMQVIWGNREGEYFCEGDWTGQITLIRFNKLALARKLDWSDIDRGFRQAASAIHDLLHHRPRKDVDARVKPGHDG